ncbi:nuclear transport factor 2 family protein [Kytococcus sedentarius]|uniref:nuclear transport factor 2 family protein n=1 Tax=Kytococcus sedentarius TaxID=1276 RepID=UPI0038517181
MSDDTRSDKFAQALQQLEQGDSEELLSMFSSEARLQRPEQDRQGAEEDAETFWEQYLGQFSEVATEFERIVEAEDEGILEWRSAGR